MMPSFFALLVVLALAPAAPAPAQQKQEKKEEKPQEKKKSKDAIAKEFAQKQAALKEDDAAGHFELATWAEENELSSEAQRLLRRVIKLEPDHAQARAKLGYVKQEGQWVQDADLKKQEEERYKREGYVKVNGEWVKKAEADMAKKGLIRHEGRWITKEDKKELDAGKVRHPLTGEWIAAEDLPKANEGKFLINTQWVDKATADKFHKDSMRPWVLISNHFVLKGTLPFDKMEEARNEAESCMLLAKPAFGQHEPIPPLPILLFETREDYIGFSRVSQTGLSTYGAFYAPTHEERPVAVFYGEKDWGPYYLRHGIGLLFAHRLLEEAEAKMPDVHWFPTGMGAYVSLWANKGHAQHFGKQYQTKGGIRNLKGFFKSFDISPDMPSEEMQWNVYQAGIVIGSCLDGGDKQLAEVIDGVHQAFAKRKGVEAAIKKLETSVQGEEKALKTYLDKLIAGS